MGKFDEMSKYILDNIGGVGNITNVTHCATRLRIEVAKPSLVDVEALKKAPEQAGLVEKGRQYQIIIGPKVNDAYNEFLAVSGWKEGMNAGVEIEDSNANQPHNAKWVMDKIAGFMAPGHDRGRHDPGNRPRRHQLLRSGYQHRHGEHLHGTVPGRLHLLPHLGRHLHVQAAENA